MACGARSPDHNTAKAKPAISTGTPTTNPRRVRAHSRPTDAPGDRAGTGNAAASIAGAGAPAPRILTHPVWCRPCMLRECPIGHGCMRGVAPADVAALLP